MVGHEMDFSARVVSMFVIVHAAAPVGLFDQTRLPAVSTAKHSDVVGHEMLCRLCPLATVRAVHVPVGSVVVITRPPVSVAAQKLSDTQSTSVVRLIPEISAFDHAGPPVHAYPFPLLSPAMHSVADAQLTTDTREPAADPVHVEAPPAGFVVVSAFEPKPLAAAQNVVVGQSTSKMASVSNVVEVQAPAPPVGSVEVTIRPPEPVATHSVVDAHEIDSSEAPGIDVACHALAPPVGFVEVRIVSPVVTAAQNVVVGHETFQTRSPDARRVSVQAEAPPVGLVEVTIRPPSPTAVQKDAVGHETSLR